MRAPLNKNFLILQLPLDKNYLTGRGFIALISILIISAVILLIALGVSQFGISQSKIALQRNQTSESYYLAQSCAEEALMKLKEDLGYRGNEILNIEGNSCAILSVGGSGNRNRLVKTTSNAYNQIRKIKIEIDRINPLMEIKYWQEVANF